MNEPQWWGSLMAWSSAPALEQTAITYDGRTHAIGIVDVPNYYAPVGAYPARRVWCLADPATGLPGAVLSDHRYVARMFAEAALTEAAAIGADRVTDVVDRVDGIPSLMAVLDTSGPRPTPLSAWLVAAAEPHRGRIRIYYTHSTAYPAKLAADVCPTWSDGAPVPTWTAHYAEARPDVAGAPSWVAAAAAVIAATNPDAAPKGPRA